MPETNISAAVALIIAGALLKAIFDFVKDRMLARNSMIDTVNERSIRHDERIGKNGQAPEGASQNLAILNAIAKLEATVEKHRYESHSLSNQLSSFISRIDVTSAEHARRLDGMERKIEQLQAASGR